jgi:hypothetical protein
MVLEYGSHMLLKTNITDSSCLYLACFADNFANISESKFLLCLNCFSNNHGIISLSYYFNEFSIINYCYFLNNTQKSTTERAILRFLERTVTFSHCFLSVIVKDYFMVQKVV